MERIKSFARRFWSEEFNRIDQFSIVERWSTVFQKAEERCVLSRVLQQRVKAIQGSYGFVDVWVIARLELSVLCLLASAAPGVQSWEFFLALIGAYSIFEALVVQVNVLVFSGYRKGTEGGRHEVKSYRRLVLTSLHNYAEIIVWFALFYRNLEWAFSSGRLPINSFWVSLNFSFCTMTTFGYTQVTPSSYLGIAVTLIQSTIGLLMVLLILSGFISLLPPPFTKDEAEQDEHTALR
jgi:hypothetical protein